MTLLEFINTTESDYDCYDTVYDTCVTACYIGEENDDYDKFCNKLMSKVDVKEHYGDCSLCVEWTDFIKRNYDKLKAFADEYWRTSYEDEDEFIYQWVREFDLYMAGYVGGSFYATLVDLVDELV